MYTLSLAPSAERDIARLRQRVPKQDFERMRSSIRQLAIEPRPHGVKKLKSIEETYRIRVGSYRVVYKVYDDANVVLILRVLRRTETTYHV